MLTSDDLILLPHFIHRKFDFPLCLVLVHEIIPFFLLFRQALLYAEAVVVVEQRQNVRKAYHQQRRTAHRYARPHWGDEDV